VYIIIKEILDRIFSLLIFVLLSPVFLIVCLLLVISNKGVVFFLQHRPGKNEKIFKIIKFKTMNDRKDSNGQLLPDADRLTYMGRFVRATSIDEIPQLINVFKGDMSFVGPRPLLVSYLPLYDEHQRRRHLVKPGITGWAQINGRNAISWEEKFEYDIWYVDNLSFLLDVKILVVTFFKVIKAKNVSSANSVTVDKFKGTR
jgi:lipopolysaccharide/colanic/teichoic acid biosynthesis glycosyltransferase